MQLLEKRCEPVPLGTPPLPPGEVRTLMEDLPGWTVKDNALEREFKFRHFREAMEFANKVATLAESEDHHPDIHIYYNRVKLILSTHRIGGLSYNDFIMAAKAGSIT
jgi:4a-hydroxytetrahydrobiopterin dehydratase